MVTPAAWRERADEVASGLVASFTLGSGQFCTNPGVVLVPDVAALIAAMPALTSARMLTPQLADAFLSALGELSATPGVQVALRGDPVEDGTPTPVVLHTTAATVVADPQILERECFGPSTLLVEYTHKAEVYDVIAALRGHLTATIQAGSDDDEFALSLVPLLAEHAGRVLWNDWPTGVTVSDAQQHGGPYPASTAPVTTSVGTAAVARFLRPVAFQNLPEAALPAELRDNVRGPRLIDGYPTV